MKKYILLLYFLSAILSLKAAGKPSFPHVAEHPEANYFPLVAKGMAAHIVSDADDYKVVDISKGLFADDVERVTGLRPRVVTSASVRKMPKGMSLVVGTIGHSRIIDEIVRRGEIDVSAIKGKWESFIITTVTKKNGNLLVIAGSDRRGTAYGLMSLSEAIGVSPWYWWADVVPKHRNAIYIEPGTFRQGEPSVQYRGIFINDERFGGWARWAENHFDKEIGKVGPKTYEKVFELLLRLKANYLWPAMHPGTQAFNHDPDNARLADDYAIVMGSSHCEQMLRNNEGEWKAVNERAQAKGERGLGDFNYLTNRTTMQNYWEERVRSNGKYENSYTLGLRGIHDYPMEGASTTAERVAIMQQAINDQRDMLKRNINRPIEEIPQVLCTYEEVLDAYHNGLQVPDDVTLLWSDDKHGYCRNLCNPEEMKRRGGAGIYYHLSYHGDPASWIWLSPLSPAFLSAELTKAYTFGAKKIWVFNVGDIKPAEKEISFVMELAWDINRWKPEEAHHYIKYWASKTLGESFSQDIADMQAGYYQLQASGKDSHVWFVNYTKEQIEQRIKRWRSLSSRAELLAKRMPESMQNAFFELVHYPIRGAAMMNEYQLLARRSMVRATEGDSIGAMSDANRVKQMFTDLNSWTDHYNHEIQNGKWTNFFSWQPYHWFRSDKIDPPICTPELIQAQKRNAYPQFLSVADALTGGGAIIESGVDCEVPVWMEALSPINNFSKAPEDNVFCHVTTDNDSFDASATPINNVWHAHYVGPMWSRVGMLHLKKGRNKLYVTNLKSDARIEKIFVGLWPPFSREPRQRIAASDYQKKYDGKDVRITKVEQLGYEDGVLGQPFGTRYYQVDEISSAPYAEYDIDIKDGDKAIEICTLPTLHVYEGRDARYAVQIGDAKPQVFSIHVADFSAEWRQNVLRGYASRIVPIPLSHAGKLHLKVFLLEPSIVLQEINILNEESAPRTEH
jgi:hypothetical protein